MKDYTSKISEYLKQRVNAQDTLSARFPWMSENCQKGVAAICDTILKPEQNSIRYPNILARKRVEDIVSTINQINIPTIESMLNKALNEKRLEDL